MALVIQIITSFFLIKANSSVDLDVRALVGEEHTTRAVCVLLPAVKEVTSVPL